MTEDRETEPRPLVNPLHWIRRDIEGRRIILEEAETVSVNGKPWTITSVRFDLQDENENG